MKEQRVVEENHFCYDGEIPINNDNACVWDRQLGFLFVIVVTEFLICQF